VIPNLKGPIMGRELDYYRRIKTYGGTSPTTLNCTPKFAAMSFRGNLARVVLTGFMGAGKIHRWAGRLPKELAGISLMWMTTLRRQQVSLRKYFSTL